MKAERISLFVAIFCGILIGALSAQSIANAFTFGKYFWFLGAALGGMVAWIGVDLRRFASGAKLAVQHAWNQVINWRPKINWKRIGNYWKGYFLFFLSFYFFLLYFQMFVFCWTGLDQFGDQKFVRGLIAFQVIMILLAVAMAFQAQEKYDHEDALRFFLVMNPIGVMHWVIKLLIWFFVDALPFMAKGTIWLAVRTPSATMVTLRFLRRALKLMFLYTNSERRTAAFVFAAIGASVGYFIGYVPIVALVGAAFGVLEFEFAKKVRDKLADDRLTT